MDGWTGRLLRVDLSTGSIAKEDVPKKILEDYIGGSGLGAKIFHDEISPDVDPLSPENKLLIMTGPLTGTLAPTGGRYMVITKSPLTGIWLETNSGGQWGAELKFAGYDGIIIEGRSEKPVYLEIFDGEVTLKGASSVWGKTLGETTAVLKEAVKDDDAKVLAIGPAGEEGVLTACVVNELGRAAGRGGSGAVMGSKNLKAIVVRGTGSVTVTHPKEFKESVVKSLAMMRENPVTGTALYAYGTPVLVNIINTNGIFPTRNFSTGVFEGAENISGEQMAATILKKKTACFACPIACGRYCSVKAEFEVEGEGPEYESIWAFGAQCGVDNLPAIAKANYLCNEYGIDTISMGNTIGCAMEAYERGLLKDTGGLVLNFGNTEAMLEAVELTGKNEGIGKMLALGSKRLAESVGEPGLSMSVKGLELPAYDPRGVKGQGLGYATSNRGGCHVQAYMISPEILGLPEQLDRLAIEGKPAFVKMLQDFVCMVNALGMCEFTGFALGADEYAALLSHAVGREYTVDQFMEAGERLFNLKRMMNVAMGVSREDDTLPERLLTTPMPEGPVAGHLPETEKMIDEYYQLRGWNPDGVPADEKLSELGLLK